MKAIFVTMLTSSVVFSFAETLNAEILPSCANHTMQMLRNRLQSSTTDLERQQIIHREEELLSAVRSVVKVTENYGQKSYDQSFNGTATHLGNGWFITAAHIFDKQVEIILSTKQESGDSTQRFKLSDGISQVFASDGLISLDRSAIEEVKQIQGYTSSDGSWTRVIQDVKIQLNDGRSIRSPKIRLFRPIPSAAFISNMQYNGSATFGYLIPEPDLVLFKVDLETLPEVSQSVIANLRSEIIITKNLKAGDWVEAIPWGENFVRFPIEEVNNNGFGAWSFPKPVYQMRKCPNDFSAESIFSDRFTEKLEVLFGVPSALTMSGSPIFTKNSDDRVGVVALSTSTGEANLTSKSVSSYGEDSNHGIYSYITFTGRLEGWISKLTNAKTK